MSNPYLTFALCVQALRRQAEAATYGLGGAIGVASDPYPHQLANVKRILTDTRIRHLISDEVGLGKTVQSLMVINALRWQNPSHKTVVVAPEKLTQQWQNEIWTRGHLKAVVPGGEVRKEKPSIWIVRPQNLQDRSFELSSLDYDLLIVDEPQIMPVDVIKTILRSSSKFRQMLVLSATPRLADQKWRNWIMKILEPEREAIANSKDMLLDEYLELLENDALEWVNEVSDFEHDTAFATSSLNRRIIRQTREDWGRYLPKRKVEMVRFEPIETESRCIEIARDVLRNHGASNDLQTWPWTDVRALQRRRWSAMDALTNIAEKEKNLADSAREVREQIKENPGDTRFEALLDVLRREGFNNGEERFIIVTGDTGTIDMLSGALPRYFTELKKENAIAELRKPVAANDTAFDSVAHMSKALKHFIDGEARILLLGHWVEAGLNLHHNTRNIIFYSLPWQPDSVDQLIGRIDRLRHNGLWKGDKGDHFGYIRIWCLIMTGSQEEDIAKGYEAIQLFDRPLPPLSSRDRLQLVNNIETLARNSTNQTVLDEMSKHCMEWHESESYSDLNHFCPFTPKQAEKEYEIWKHTPLIEPILTSPKDGLPLISRCEQALGGWLKLIELSEDFYIGNRSDFQEEHISFRTMWYLDKNKIEQPFGLSALEQPRDKTDNVSPNWLTDHAPFISYRRDLQAPPKVTVVTDEGEIMNEGKSHGRLLHFLDFGDDIHDDLVNGYCNIGKNQFSTNQENSYLVHVPAGHPALVHERKIILLTAAYYDPSQVFAKPELEEIKLLIKNAPTGKSKNLLLQSKKLLDEMVRADQRWLCSIIPAYLELWASEFKEKRWDDIVSSDVPGFFKPLINKDKKKITPRCKKVDLFVSREVLRHEKDRHRTRILWKVKQEWAEQVRTLKEVISSRLICIRTDGEDIIEQKKIMLNKKSVSYDNANKKQVDMERGKVEAAKRELKMAELMLKTRCNVLRKAVKKLDQGSLHPSNEWNFLVRFVSFDD